MPLVTPRDQFPAAPPGADPSRPSTWWPAVILSQAATTNRHLGELPDAVLLDGTVAGYANHGRWVADCPSCNAAQVIDPDDPRFWCPFCSLGWRTITFAADHRSVDEVLSERAEPENRNWWPHETVADLRTENRTQGGDSN